MRVLLLTLFLTSCGAFDQIFDDHVYQSNRPDDYSSAIDPDFLPYYDLFAKIRVSKRPSVPIRYGTLDGNTVGLCEWGSDWRRITVDKKFWSTASESNKQVLVLHELGHCALHRPHDSEMKHTDDFGDIPESIMYPSVIGDEQAFPTYKDYYFKELVK